MAAFFCPQTEELSGQHWYGISYLRLSKLGKRYESESIDTSASCAERIKQYVEQVGDPYCYTDSGIVVKLAYSNTDVSLQDRLRAYACSLS